MVQKTSYALITGGAGFIGVNLCQYLLKNNYKIIVIDNFVTSSKINSIVFIKNKNITFIQHNIVNTFPKKILSQIPRLDVIFHLACPTGVPNIAKKGEEMLRTCSEGTRNVLELARKFQSKVLLTSSSEVYGDPLVHPQKETYTGNVDPLGVRGPYEEGKRFAEALMKLYVSKYGVHGKIVRIFNTYGPYMSLYDTRVIPSFISALKNNNPIPIQGDGLQTRTFCYIDDLIQGLVTVLEKGNDGDVYNLGSDKEIAIIELAKLLETTSGKKITIKKVERPKHDHQQRLPSLEKIRSIGWKPKVSLAEGIRKTIRWYQVA